jgi:hypothetical protein
MQVMANHSSRDVIDAVHRLSVARAEATQQHEALLSGSTDFAGIDALVKQPNDPILKTVAKMRAASSDKLQGGAGGAPEPRRANG